MQPQTIPNFLTDETLLRLEEALAAAYTRWQEADRNLRDYLEYTGAAADWRKNKLSTETRSRLEEVQRLQKRIHERVLELRGKGPNR